MLFFMEESPANIEAIDKAIDYANEDKFQAALAWSNIALAIVESNRSEVTKALAEAAFAWLKNPTEESFANLSLTASYYESLNETQA